jgi:hypothetical protein
VANLSKDEGANSPAKGKLGQRDCNMDEPCFYCQFLRCFEALKERIMSIHIFDSRLIQAATLRMCVGFFLGWPHSAYGTIQKFFCARSEYIIGTLARVMSCQLR